MLFTGVFILKAKIFYLLVFILVACQNQSGPESLLKEFVEKRFNSQMDQKEALSYLSGPMHELISSMSQEEYDEFKDLKDYRLKLFKIVDKKEEGGRTFVTYLIDYSLNKEGKVEFETQVKKVAELVKEDQWKIFKIDNLKTLHHSKLPIDIGVE